MFTHHVITCALIFTRYGYHQTKVGNLILCLMGVVDIVLPVSFSSALALLPGLTSSGASAGQDVQVHAVPSSVRCRFCRLHDHLARHQTRFVPASLLLGLLRHPKEITSGCYSGSMGHLRSPIEPLDFFTHLTRPFRDPEGLVCWNNGGLPRDVVESPGHPIVVVRYDLTRGLASRAWRRSRRLEGR